MKRITQPTIDPARELLTAKELAVVTAMGLSWIHRKTKSNEIPHCRLGRSIRYPKSEVTKWIVSNMRGTI